MSSDQARHVPDARYLPRGEGHGDTRTLAMCGHKARSGKRIGTVLIRCEACVKAKEQR